MKKWKWGILCILPLLFLSCQNAANNDTSSTSTAAAPAPTVSTPTTYSVRFITENATKIYETVSVQGPEYKLALVPAPPAKTGYQFAGWFTEPQGKGTKVIVLMNVKANFDAYDHWSEYLYTIQFDSGTADVAAEPKTMTAGSPQCNLGALPTEPKKASYIFDGWYTSSTGSGDRITPSTVFTSDTTLYARWNAFARIVSYEADNGSNTLFAQKTVDSPAMTVSVLPSEPSKKGYSFGGWFTLPEGKGTAFTSSTPVNAHITVYAMWVSYSRTVTFNDAGAAVQANPSTMTVSSPATTLGTLPRSSGKNGIHF